ncbi:hypothetical protein PRK78_004108 [Emydomyces testavorans]|uniref:Uncharacterized protein n=1 Tax=Emydomyces testavorans TaxID=2070801 RepID=A0AAF0DKJ0_9EURO|nr:hypothetical protein PRK78_004108 [Emydomyces testavorans]
MDPFLEPCKKVPSVEILQAPMQSNLFLDLSTIGSRCLGKGARIREDRRSSFDKSVEPRNLNKLQCGSEMEWSLLKSEKDRAKSVDKMLSIAQVSGLIAAAVMIDAVSTHHVQHPTNSFSWISTVGAGILVLSGVLTPLGLHETVVPGDPESVQFEYVKDPSQWGKVTLPRPNSKFTRLCESGRTINCPGQFQGVIFNETSPGRFESVETYPSATINLTIPRNFTAMFSSATADRGNTLSGLFDIQYRRWKIGRWGVYDKGQPYVKGDSRQIESLITQNTKPLLREGLIIDMRETPGIGFRNHTVPVGLEHGGTWSEDITWIEPVTRCADTNLSVELRTENSVEKVSDNHTFFIVDRGAFVDLDQTALETRPWIDNQTLDLFGRAHKAARMHNVLFAATMNISLPLNPPTKTLPKIQIKETDGPTLNVFSYLNFDTISLVGMKGLGGSVPEIPAYNSSDPKSPKFVPYYPDGFVKLVALNYSAITQICRGYYSVGSSDLDLRANNITYPAVQCGYLIGAPGTASPENVSPSEFSGIETRQKNLYVCASAVRASVKTVDFRYNGTGGTFSNLEVLRIADKTYPDEGSKPLWASEHSFDKRMKFDPLWGLIDERFANMEGFYSLRAEKLWLATSPFLTTNFGETEGYDALAAVSGFNRRLGNLYGSLNVKARDYSGQFEYALFERFQQLSKNETTASQIPSLILNDGLAGGLVGTKTSISTKYVSWPASMAVDDPPRGFPRAKVIKYKRVIRYDIRYAIPAFLVLAIYVAALVGASVVAVVSPSIIRTMQHMYNQTSAGRLAVNLLRDGVGYDYKQPSSEWVKGDGKLQLRFGAMGEPEEQYFCMIVPESPNHEPKSGGRLLPVVEDSHTMDVEPPKQSDRRGI